MAQTKIKNKKLIYTTAVFLLLLVYFLVFETRIEQKEKSKNNLFDYTIADVKTVEIQTSGRVIRLERVMNDWLIRKPRELKGSKPDIDAYLYDVKDLQKDKVIGKNLPDLNLYGLKTPKIVFRIWTTARKNEDQLLTLNLGEQNPDKSAYYAKFENQPEIFLLEIKAESTLDRELFFFRDKEVFQVKSGDVKQITCNQEALNYELNLEGQSWIINSPVSYSNLNQADVKKVLGNILDISIKKFFDDKDAVPVPDAGLLSPNIRIKLVDNKNKAFTLLAGREIRNENQYYARLENANLVFGIDKTIVNDLVRDLQKIADKKKEDEKKLEEQKKKELEKQLKEAKKKGKKDDKKK
ncbi:MAG: DUF4340 domain-containing protein [bacterium]|nr:DUF4340 domain-containing protein [bacterium]